MDADWTDTGWTCKKVKAKAKGKRLKVLLDLFRLKLLAKVERLKFTWLGFWFLVPGRC